MNNSRPTSGDRFSAAERDLLCRSVRELLARRWPAETAVERSGSADAVAEIWREMAGQGLAMLGDDAEVGLGGILLVFEELGRAGCPAPLLRAVAARLGNMQSNAMRA